MNGFRSACKVQARAALDINSQWWSHYAPSGAGRTIARASFLLLMPITMFFWFIQGLLWTMISVPLLTYALVMALAGGGVAPRTRTSKGASLPPPLPLDPEKDEAYWDAYVARVTAGKSDRWMRSHAPRSKRRAVAPPLPPPLS